MKKEIFLSFINKLTSRLGGNDGLIQVILGPRQVGKTTTILKLIDEQYKDVSRYVSADTVFNPGAAWLRGEWQNAIEKNQILFIDEIQKIDNWSEAIKALYDETKRAKKKIKCVLLGSSSLAIQSGLTESLTGRFQLINAYHWNYKESHQAYGLNFEEYVRYGGYPGSYRFIHTDDWNDYVLNSIINTVIEKDILLYHAVKKPALFKQAFEIIVSYPAQEISYAKLLGQLQDGGNTDLIKYYLELYQGAFLIKILEKYSEKVIKIKASSPKIIPLAPCIPYIQTRTAYDAEVKGRIFELMVGAQLVRTNEQLYYWREGKFEVDYVLKSGSKVFAIEVKSGKKRSERGLEEFKKRFKKARGIIINLENYIEFENDPMSFLEKWSL